MTEFVERERKFIVDDLSVIQGHTPERIVQAYIVDTDEVELRIRLASSGATLTVKSGDTFLTRAEYEYPLDNQALAIALFDSSDARIIKDRYSLVTSDGVWDIDAFLGPNEGLILAEIEFHEHETISIPPWCGAEVTADARYYNRYLARNPYQSWAV
jgi:CYTH domain-containing protein